MKNYLDFFLQTLRHLRPVSISTILLRSPCLPYVEDSLECFEGDCNLHLNTFTQYIRWFNFHGRNREVHPGSYYISPDRLIVRSIVEPAVQLQSF